MGHGNDNGEKCNIMEAVLSIVTMKSVKIIKILPTLLQSSIVRSVGP